MGKKREKYLYSILLQVTNPISPKTFGEAKRYERHLSKAIARTRKDVKSKYKNTEHIPKEWR